ncbi:Scaffold attachment factor B2 [Eumeta japonica]|uniref:Scaffold attachment factor B2 n=1 Tax=Eumeta variegata TaxID=151549 RepID=A0A4C1VJX0_EUMVA|nr:Scaffold attachment factor B2 [Eumeta japonica]
MSDRKRSLNDLRVIDLRLELEKRNLDKSGVRCVLVQRLSKYLEEEGHDPDTFKFELAADKTPNKRTRRSDSIVEQEPEETETPVMEDMIVQDDAGEEDETEQPEVKLEVVSDEPLKQEKMDVESTNEPKTSRKRESKDEPEVPQSKKLCLKKEIKLEDDHKAPENNTDAEDSINLDLGDDELLNEEVRFYVFRVTVKLSSADAKLANGFAMDID